MIQIIRIIIKSIINKPRIEIINDYYLNNSLDVTKNTNFGKDLTNMIFSTSDKILNDFYQIPPKLFYKLIQKPYNFSYTLFIQNKNKDFDYLSFMNS